MQPFSDIDLLILITSKDYKEFKKNIAKFIALLWDIDLEVGSSVRDIKECNLAVNDIMVATNLLDARVIIGNTNLLNKITKHFTNQEFFLAKQKEQQNRYKNLIIAIIVLNQILKKVLVVCVTFTQLNGLLNLLIILILIF